MVSWMSMNRIGQNPGRGWGKSCRDPKNPVSVTAATASQPISPTVRTHGADPDSMAFLLPSIAGIWMAVAWPLDQQRWTRFGMTVAGYS